MKNKHIKMFEEMNGSVFKDLLAHIAEDGILKVSKIMKDSGGNEYVTIKFPNDFKDVTGLNNTALNREFLMIDDMDGMEVTLTDDIDSDEGGSARSMSELYDFFFVKDEDVEKYKKSKK